MLVDLGDRPALHVDPASQIVVGSGAAGLALAERLAASGALVVVVESGSVRSVQPDERAADLNTGHTAGLTYNGLTAGRARTLGGSTALWHGQVMRLHDLDLAERDWIPDSGWPFGPDVLAPFYAAAEAWSHVSGRGYGAERWKEHPRLEPVGWDPAILEHDFTEYLSKPMLGRSHRSNLERNPRIIVIGGATVGRVLLAPDGSACGVSGFRSDATPFEFHGSSVTLAAGAIENARLLALSDPSGVGLGTGRLHTGRWLQDHPIIRTAEVVARDPRFLQDRYIALHRRRRRLFPKVRLAPEVQVRERLLDAVAVFQHERDDPASDAARRLVLAARSRRRPEHVGADLRAALRAPVPIARDAYRRYARGLSTSGRPSHVWLQLWLEQVPDRDNRVTLADSVDRFGLRQVAVEWRVDDLTIATSRRLTRLIGHDLERLGIATIHELDAMHDDDAWRATVHDAYHPSGTTRMSVSPQEGVVGPDLQVHGVPRLHVVGGSVFPIAGYANPTLTIVALALRLADRLAALPARH